MRRNTGLSLLEVLIAVAVLAVVLGTVYALLFSSTTTYTNEQRRGSIEDDCRRVLDEMARELREADQDVTITKANGSDSITIQVPIGYDNGAATWSTPIQYRCEPSNVDANNNGIQDEGRLVRIQDGMTLVLCNSVKQGGLVVKLVNGNITITVTLIVTDERNRVLESTLSTSATPRN